MADRQNDRVRAELTAIYRAAIDAVEPGALIASALTGAARAASEIPSIVNQAQRIFVLAIGKAARAMALQIERALADKFVDALAVVPDGLSLPAANSRVRFLVGAHPLPDERSVAAADAALAMLSEAHAGDLVIVALSGGASAMFVKPAAGVSLADKIAITQSLLRSGASIRELNLVRKHLSAVKGGQLLRATEARMLTLILSDVPGNDLATIGSGVTVADPSTFADAIGVLKRRGLWGRAPEPIRDRLERGVAAEIDETVKADDPSLTRVTNLIIGDNTTALDAAERAARKLGYSPRRGLPLNSEAADLGRTLAREFESIRDSRVCMLAGGEPVVTVRGSGRGGRAQHLALALALELGTSGARVAALCAGTDGIDGPTEAAGAFVFPDSLARAESLSLSATDALRRADAYNFFNSLGDSLVVGPTGTNVTDVFLALVNYD